MDCAHQLYNASAKYEAIEALKQMLPLAQTLTHKLSLTVTLDSTRIHALYIYGATHCLHSSWPIWPAMAHAS